MAKRLFCTILVISLISVCFCSSVFAEEQTGFWFGMSKDGNKYTITLNMNGEAGPEMLQFRLRYDPDKLHLDSADQGDVFKEYIQPTFSFKGDGYIYFIWDDLKPLVNGQLFVMNFTVLDDVDGSTFIGFDRDYESIAADGEYNIIDMKFGSLQIPLEMAENISNDQNNVNISTNDNYEVAAGQDEIDWFSTDTSVAVIEDGKIVGKSEGNAQIFVRRPGETEYKSYTIEVKQADLKKQDNTIKYSSIASAVLLVVIITAVLLRKKKAAVNTNEE